jgi:hypothetical protein
MISDAVVFAFTGFCIADTDFMEPGLPRCGTVVVPVALYLCILYFTLLPGTHKFLILLRSNTQGRLF